MNIIFKAVLFFIILFIVSLVGFYFMTIPVGAIFVDFGNVAVVISLFMSCFGSLAYTFYMNR